MTTQESLLALATRMGKGVHHGWLNEGRGLFVRDGNAYRQFDPANNDAQAMEVLCWLLAECKGYAHAEMGTVGIFYDGGEEGDGHWRHFPHDNTPASLRSAIVQAACRVVGG